MATLDAAADAYRSYLLSAAEDAATLVRRIQSVITKCWIWEIHSMNQSRPDRACARWHVSSCNYYSDPQRSRLRRSENRIRRHRVENDPIGIRRDAMAHLLCGCICTRDGRALSFHLQPALGVDLGAKDPAMCSTRPKPTESIRPTEGIQTMPPDRVDIRLLRFNARIPDLINKHRGPSRPRCRAPYR